MAKFKDWSSDVEVKDFANKLKTAYPDIFGHIDLEKIQFFRVFKSSTKVAKIVPVKFPHDAVSCTHVYTIMTYNARWNIFSEAQKIAAVFQQLISIPEGGFDPESEFYAKMKRKDVNEYSEFLCAVGMNFNWEAVGAVIPNIIDSPVSIHKKDLEAPSA